MFKLLIASLLLVSAWLPAITRNPAKEKSPNVIIIFADDLGYGDLGCYGAPKIKTPHIDQLAAGGMRFTNFYAASPVCSASRAALLTGKYPFRTGINGVLNPTSTNGIRAEEVTIAELLKKQGYATAAVGKWHLGHQREFLPLQNGFDEFLGLPYSNDMKPIYLMRDNEAVADSLDQSTLTGQYTQKVLQFMDKNKQQPFFLYLAHTFPHVPLYASARFKGQSAQGIYGDVVEELDWSVGEVLRKLKALQLEENTIVIFSSDNGPWLVKEAHGGSAGILREGKQTTFEGGMRVPGIVSWKGRIKAGQTTGQLGTTMDLLPTLVTLTNSQLPAGHSLDGMDISGVLLGKTPPFDRDFAYIYSSGLEAYRSGNWKLKLPYKGTVGVPNKLKEVAPHPILLFDLQTDPGEKVNLAGQLPEKVKEMEAKIAAFKQESGALTFDRGTK